MSNQTKTITLPTIENGYSRPGPWSSTFDVNVQTLAVNLCQRASFLESDLETAVTSMIEQGDEDGTLSIGGFWGVQFGRLTSDAVAAVAVRAQELLDLGHDAYYETYDGQR